VQGAPAATADSRKRHQDLSRLCIGTTARVVSEDLMCRTRVTEAVSSAAAGAAVHSLVHTAGSDR
jgi:hypothetical protein